jgi:hypothetical protein
VTAESEARALYTSEREQLAREVTAEIKRLVEARDLVVESTPPSLGREEREHAKTWLRRD